MFTVIDTLEKLLLDAIMSVTSFYYVAKLVFLCWMFFPGYMGVNSIYGAVVPLFNKVSGALEKVE
jgi:hypothetical protein